MAGEDDFWGGLKTAPTAHGADNFWGDLQPPATDTAAFIRKQQQPTQFERERANESNTPWTDIAKGFGEGALKTVANVGTAIHAIPKVGPALIPSAGLAAEKQIATPRTVGEKTGSAMEGAAEMLLPVGEAAEAIKGSRFVRPAAQYAEENILPAIRAIPVLGRGVRAAESAPTLGKAAIRGAISGAGLGGLEEGYRTRSPIGAMRGAAEGGTIGALTGMGAYGIRSLAAPPEEPAWLGNLRSHIEEPIPPRRPVPEAIPAVGAPAGEPTFQAGRMGDMRQVSMSAGGQQQGYLDYSMDPKTRIASVDSSLIASPEFEGKGFGRQMYEKAIEDAKAQGAKTFSSGTAPEPGAERVWKSLGDKYDVKKTGGTYSIDLTKPEPAGVKQGAKTPISRIGSLIEEGAGTPKLQPNVPLREQLPGRQGIPGVAKEAEDPLKLKYPDAAERQMVRANGERMFQAVGDDKELMKDVHDLTRVDLREALINSGEDMGQQTVSNSKFAGKGSITREDAFNRMLSKGLSPRQIVDLAKPPKQAAD